MGLYGLVGLVEYVDMLNVLALREENRLSKGLEGPFAGEATPEWLCMGRSVVETVFSSSSFVNDPSFLRKSERVRSVIDRLRDTVCSETDALGASLILDIIWPGDLNVGPFSGSFPLSSGFSGSTRGSSGIRDGPDPTISRLLADFGGSGLFTRLAVPVSALALVKSGLLTRIAASGIWGDILGSGLMADLAGSGLLTGLSVCELFVDKY